MNREAFFQSIEQLDYHQARALLEEAPEDEEQLVDLLAEWAFSQQDIRIYTFFADIAAAEKSWKWHYVASFLLCQPLCSVKGAYFAGLFHALKAVELNPSDSSLKEHVLFYYDVPDRPMSDDKAVEIANALLVQVPDHPSALSVIAEVERRAKAP